MLLRKTQAESKAEKEAKKPTIKKPLNAFMLYMKEMRAKVIAECTLKESAAINQILGRRVRPQARWAGRGGTSLMIALHIPSAPPSPLQWHALSREEQAKYYELARKERQLHMQLYPGWSARDNYVSGQQHTGMGRGTFKIPCPGPQSQQERTIVLKAQMRKVVDWWRVHGLPWLAQEMIKQGEPPLKADLFFTQDLVPCRAVSQYLIGAQGQKERKGPGSYSSIQNGDKCEKGRRNP